MRSCSTVVALCLAFVAGLPATSLAGKRYTSQDSLYISNAMYRALLDRRVDSSSASAAAEEIAKGNLEQQAESITRSGEFLDLERKKSSEQMLNQIYKGLLNRKPDDAGRQSFMPKIRQKKYAEVTVSIIESAEFEAKMNGRPQPRPKRK